MQDDCDRRDDAGSERRIIQAVMGWRTHTFHVFNAGGVCYSEASPEWEVEIVDERRRRLADIAREVGEAFIYKYDRGDSWHHQVLVEEVVYRDDFPDAECVTRERACPPEDAGGVGGYYEMLATL